MKPYVPLFQRPWTLPSSGRAIELLDAKPEQIDLVDMATMLAAAPRFNGSTASEDGVTISIAQHCVMAADILFARTGRRDMGAAGLAHDGHEYIVGDESTPKQKATGLALARVAKAEGLRLVDAQGAEVSLPGLYDRGMAALKDGLDAVIYPKFGLPWPLPADIHAAVKQVDRDLLVAEAARCLPEPPWTGGFPNDPPIDLDVFCEDGVYAPWPAARAAQEFIRRAALYAPDCALVKGLVDDMIRGERFVLLDEPEDNRRQEFAPA